MRRRPTAFAVFLFAAALAGPVAGEPVRAACLASGRDAAEPRLCKCVQVAADATLTAPEQQRAAGFFQDPHQAQVVRQSKQRSDGLFWERYEEFTELAKAFCAG